jgi:hypothetical protein
MFEHSYTTTQFVHILINSLATFLLMTSSIPKLDFVGRIEPARFDDLSDSEVSTVSSTQRISEELLVSDISDQKPR